MENSVSWLRNLDNGKTFFLIALNFPSVPKSVCFIL